ncbi:MAG: hypothetical protein A2V86_07690 [Deltaproteobacteria bacterium RBG_16_49_23]|nr:MAG: hypothetical protein A2V86_07690 [Deltaproteobacteria bacterium RBG_16_49_23]
MFFLPLAKGGGLPARSRSGEGRGGILKSLIQTAKLIPDYLWSKIDILFLKSPLSPGCPPGQRPYGPAAKEGNSSENSEDPFPILTKKWNLI